MNNFWLPIRRVSRGISVLKHKWREKCHKMRYGHYRVIFPEMALAHRYCVGRGIEIGASAHNPFGLNTINVDLFPKSHWKKEEKRFAGETRKVDMVASADKIPVADSSFDFVISSHVLEHMPNTIEALREWDRVVRSGGVIFMIVPHRDRTYDCERERTTLAHIIQDFEDGVEIVTPKEELFAHHHVWITEDVIEIIEYMINNKLVAWEIEEIEDVDSKAGNGFTIVCRKLSDSKRIS